MPAITADVKITKNCRLCGKPMHLYQGSDGSVWYHDTVAAEHQCWQGNRSDYETGAEL
jgi:hypothetical protein